MNTIQTLGDRLKRINIHVKFALNYPWIYLISINGKGVTEKFNANHGFCVAFMDKNEDGKANYTDIGKMFELIRKYIS